MALNLTAAYPVVEASQVAEPRRAALALAGRLGFSEERAGRLALVVSELATNLAKHAVTRRADPARDPRRARPTAEPDGIEIVAIDAGPGIPDVALSRRDGHSTAGTLGHGLGAIERQSDFFEISYARRQAPLRWRGSGASGRRSPRRVPRYEVGAVQVSQVRRGRLRRRLGLAACATNGSP